MLPCNALVLCQVLSSTYALLFQCISVLLNPIYHNIVSIPLLRIPMSRKADKVGKGRGMGVEGGGGVNLCQRIPCSLKNLVCDILRPIFIGSFALPSCCSTKYINIYGFWFESVLIFCLFVSILKVTFLHFFARFLCLLAGCCSCEKQI